MKVTFNRSGGFANININVEVDTDTMEKDKAERLTQLVKATLPFGKDSDVRPDMFCYSLTVNDGANLYSLKTTDIDASDDLHRLFDFLLKESRTLKN